MLTGALVLVVATGYDPRAAASYFTPRYVALFPLMLLVLLTWVVSARPCAKRERFDGLDVLALLFAGWVALSAALAPVGTLAWLGQYNRGVGALVWIVLALGFLALRRMSSPTTVRGVAWGAALALALAGMSAVLQAAGTHVVWPAVDVYGGRMVGTTGNPVNLGGLVLLAAWVGSLALSAERARWERAAFAVAAALGLTGAVLAVSRAAYAGLVLALIFLVVAWTLRRRWRRVALLGAVIAAIVLAALLYSPGSAPSGALTSRIGEEAGAQQLTEADRQRTDFWRVALRAVADRPVLGFGAGAYETAFRRFAPVRLMQDSPDLVPSDPHSLPLLLAAGTGVPGAIMAAGLLIGSWVTIGRRARRDRTGDAYAPLAYTLAVTAFLMVSPADLVTVVPLVVVLALGVGAPSSGARLAAGSVGGERWPPGRWIMYAGVTVLALAFCGAVAAGVQLYRADRAEGRSITAKDQPAAVKAADIFPWFARYGVVAGTAEWRGGLHDDDPTRISRGEGLLHSVLERDPYNAHASMELARLELSRDRPAAAAAIAKQALARTPHHPVLEGLWGFAAAILARGGNEAAHATIAELQAYGPQTSDGWQWLGVALAASGDARGSREAIDHARSLAPALDEEAYKKRLQGAR